MLTPLWMKDKEWGGRKHEVYVYFLFVFIWYKDAVLKMWNSSDILERP
jgi:hypothetical protein